MALLGLPRSGFSPPVIDIGVRGGEEVCRNDMIPCHMDSDNVPVPSHTTATSTLPTSKEGDGCRRDRRGPLAPTILHG